METTLIDPNKNKLSTSTKVDEHDSNKRENNLQGGVNHFNIVKNSGYEPRNIVPINIFKKNTNLNDIFSFKKQKPYNYKR